VCRFGATVKWIPPKGAEMMPAPSCEQRRLLEERLHQATLGWLAALERLNTATSGEFQEASAAIQQARDEHRQARDDLNQHVARHGCG
jgi:hypothetical protein